MISIEDESYSDNESINSKDYLSYNKLININKSIDNLTIRPSQYKHLPCTIFIDYPIELNINRDDIKINEKLGHRKLYYKSYWERICIRNTFLTNGFVKCNNKLDNDFDSNIDNNIDDNIESNVNSTKSNNSYKSSEKSTNKSIDRSIDKSVDKYWTILWSKHQNDKQLKSFNYLQKTNHFPMSWCIGRKDRLVRTINVLKRIYPDEYNFHPDTFILPMDSELITRYIDRYIDNKPLWIVKPCASSCGKGIKVKTSNEIINLLSNNTKSYLIQKYIENPLLIQRKKFDLRVYVLVTGIDPLRVYVYEEGLTRISTSDYSLSNITNRFAHLTNYSINKKSDNFTASTNIPTNNSNNSENSFDGFKWSLMTLRKYLSTIISNEKINQIFEKINNIIVKTMICLESEISSKIRQLTNYRTNCFELFGCDILLDNFYEPSLLEVNISPSLMGSSQLDRAIKSMLVADILHLVGIYPYDNKLIKKYSNKSNNPFSFSSHSKLLLYQDAWRKDPQIMNVDFNGFNQSNSDPTIWPTILLIDDEIARSKSTKFTLVHPVISSVVHYNSIYRHNRFLDHVLGKWILLSGSTGSLQQLIPDKFIKSESKADSKIDNKKDSNIESKIANKLDIKTMGKINNYNRSFKYPTTPTKNSIKSNNNEIERELDIKLDSKINNEIDSKIDSKLFKSMSSSSLKVKLEDEYINLFKSIRPHTTKNQAVREYIRPITAKIDMKTNLPSPKKLISLFKPRAVVSNNYPSTSSSPTNSSSSLRNYNMQSDRKSNSCKNSNSKSNILITKIEKDHIDNNIDNYIDSDINNDIDGKLDIKLDIKKDNKIDRCYIHEQIHLIDRLDLPSKSFNKSINSRIDRYIDTYLEKQVANQPDNHIDTELNRYTDSYIDNQRDKQVDSPTTRDINKSLVCSYPLRKSYISNRLEG